MVDTVGRMRLRRKGSRFSTTHVALVPCSVEIVFRSAGRVQVFRTHLRVTQVDMLREQMAFEVRKLFEHQWGLRELEDLPSQLGEQVEELGRQVAGKLAQFSECHKVLHAGRECQCFFHTDESEQREGSA